MGAWATGLPGQRSLVRALLLVLLVCGVDLRPEAQTATVPLLAPSAIVYDTAGNLFIADNRRNQVLEATLGGSLLVVAGTGAQGFAGDGGSAAAAELNAPQGLAFGADGTLYIADTGNARVRAVSAGVITTFAGSGAAGYAGDGGPAASAQFRTPAALAVDASGALLVCDPADQRVRRIRGGVVSTFAGDGVQGFAGDGGSATSAELDAPSGVAVAADGRVFVADMHNQRVRVIAASGIINTFAGNGQRGFAGDGGPAQGAELSGPRGLAMASDGALLLADSGNERVRGVSSAGIITTLVGTGREGTSADGALGQSVGLRGPRALAISPLQWPAVADTLNGTVRVLTAGGTLYQPAALAPGRSSSGLQLVVAGAQTYGAAGLSVSVSGAAGVAQGTVSLSDGGTPIATAALNGGAAAFSLPSLGAGAHSLTAVYSGDGLNPAGSSSGASLTVAPITVIATADGAEVSYGSVPPVLTGTLAGVLPQDLGQVSAIFQSSAGALASVGAYPIAVSLTGPKGGDYTASLSATSGELQIRQAGSQIALSNVPQSYVGLPLQLNAHVASTTSGKPTGTVQFLDGGTVVATGAVVNGSASAAYIAPPAGSRSLSAQYSGDSNFQPSTSVPEVAVVSTMPDFGLSIAGSETATVAAGSSASYSLVVSAQPTPFTGDVTLSASGLPTGATVSFSPVQVVPGAGSATVNIIVQTAAPVALLHAGPGAGNWSLAGIVLCGALCLRKRQRRLLGLLCLGLVCGCGARTVGEGSGVIPTASYPIQITGTSTNLVGSVVTHGTTVTLVVQQ